MTIGSLPQRASKTQAVTILDRLYDMMPWSVSVAPPKAYEQRRTMPKAWAKQMGEIAPDPPGYVLALRLDVDAPDGETSWHEAGLPEPNFVVGNPQNGHAHLTWLLRVWVKRDNPKHMRYLRDLVADAARVVPGGDPAFSGKDLTHSPWSPDYRTTVITDHFYDLSELRAAIPRPPRRTKIRRVSLDDCMSRNKYVFVTGLRFGRSEMRRGVPLDAMLEREIADIMQDAATYARANIAANHPYYAHEIEASLRSVLKYLAADDVQRVFRSPEIQRLIERDRKRAHRGSQPLNVYREAFEERGSRIRALRSEGVGATEIARVLGCSRAAVYRHLKIKTDMNVAEVTSNQSVSPCPVLQDYANRTHTRVPVPVRTHARKTISPAVSDLEALLQPGERVADFAGLLDPRRCTCAMTSRENAIKRALQAVLEEREAQGVRKSVSVPTTALRAISNSVQMRLNFPPFEMGPEELDPGTITPTWAA